MEFKNNEECVVYWDYENSPIPHNAELSDVIEILTHEISSKLGYAAKLHQIRLYNNDYKKKLASKIRQDIDKLGIDYSSLFSKKSEHVDKRIIGDIGLHLLEWKDCKKTVIIFISGDTDYSFFLSAIKQKQFAKIILIPSLTFAPKNQIDKSLSNATHFIIDKFYKKKNKNAFIKCVDTTLSSTHLKNCTKYHFVKYNQSQKFTISQSAPSSKPLSNNIQKEKKKKQKGNNSNKPPAPSSLNDDLNDDSEQKQEEEDDDGDTKPKDKNAPKRPLNAYFIYIKNVRAQIEKEFPDIQKQSEIQKEIAKKWKTLSDADKLPYTQEADELKQQYKKDMKKYKKSPKGKAFAARLAKWKKAKKKKKQQSSK